MVVRGAPAIGVVPEGIKVFNSAFDVTPWENITGIITENDSEHEMEALSAWLASINPEIPLHISRFPPQYKMQGKAPTPIETIFRLRKIAEKYLTYVYVGNCG
jgi:pyruvate-formate lyase-activating enzyme